MMNKIFNFEKYYSNIALIDDKYNQLTYKQLEEKGDELYSCINKRTLVFILCSNTISSLIGYTSFLNHEIVPIMLNSNIDIELLNGIIVAYKPEYIWIPNSRIHDFTYEEICSINDYSLLKTGFSTPKMIDDLCILVTTSGSTGSVKYVRQTYKNVIADSKNTSSAWNVTSNDRLITTMPMNYTFSIMMINSHLYNGGTILLTAENILSDNFWTFFKKESATFFGGVPFIYEMLDRIDFYSMEIDSIRCLVEGGSKLSDILQIKMIADAKKRNYDFIISYGATETCGLISYLPFNKSDRKIGSIGICMPNGKLYIKKEDRIINEANIQGELVYEGDNVSLGYAERLEDLLKSDDRNGIYETGDLGFFDNDNYFFITGRKKRFAKIYGHRVSLDEIDLIVKSQFNNIEFASMSKDDRLYLFTNSKELGKSITKFLSNKTKLPISAFCTILIDAIPKNESGKIMYKDLDIYINEKCQ